MPADPYILWSATPTPFLDNGALDVGAIERMVEQHVRLGVTGLFLAGSCGEGPCMPDAQRAELVRQVRRFAGERLHLAVQASDTSAVRVRENMRQAADAGADSLVLAAPWPTTFLTEAFARRTFTESVQAAPCPVGIYVTRAGIDGGLGPAFWQAIAAELPVAYVKDSSGSADVREVLAAVNRSRSDLHVLTGDEFHVAPALAAGYDGCLLGSAILVGGMIRRMLAALAAGRHAEADTWQQRSSAFLYDLFAPDVSQWLGGLKYALRRLGLFTTEVMHLVYPLTDADRARIDAAIDREREFISPSDG